jgi:hypothetical protein
MTELIDNKLKKYFKEKFISKDGAEWYCVLDGNKPIGEVQITYFSNSGIKWTIKGRWVGTVDNGCIEGYGILENHYTEFKFEGFFIKGQFSEGRFIKNKNIKSRWIEISFKIDESKYIRYPMGKFKNKIIKGKIEFDDALKYEGSFHTDIPSDIDINPPLFKNGTFTHSLKVIYKNKNVIRKCVEIGEFYNNYNPITINFTEDYPINCIVTKKNIPFALRGKSNLIILKKGKKTYETDDKQKLELSGSFNIEGILKTGKINLINNYVNFKQDLSNGVITNAKYLYLDNEYKGSYLEGKIYRVKVKKWDKGKETFVNNGWVIFEGTKMIYKKHKNKIKLNVKITECIFNKDINIAGIPHFDKKHVIEGNIKYIDINDRYYFEGKIKNSIFSKGKILFNTINSSERPYCNLKEINGEFNGTKKFIKGKIVYKNGSNIEGDFKYNFHKLHGGLNSNIIKAKGNFYTDSDYKEPDEKVFGNLDTWYPSLFINSIGKLLENMSKNKTIITEEKSSYFYKNKKTGFSNAYEVFNKYCKILSLCGTWRNDEFIKGDIKYTFLDGEDHDVTLDNGTFKKKINRKRNLNLKNNNKKSISKKHKSIIIPAKSTISSVTTTNGITGQSNLTKI